MVHEDKVTPEERLLKIIESPAGNTPKIRPPVPKGRVKLSFIGKPVARFKGIRINREAFGKINLAGVNKMALYLCGLFTFFSLFVFIREGFALRARFEKIKTQAPTEIAAQSSLLDIDMDISSLLAASKRHDIFSLAPKAIQAESPAGQQAVSAAAAGNIKLVGIIWSDNPQAMIEDTKDQKTYLLSAGESFINFKVKEIFPDKVIMESQGKEMELR